MKRGVRVPVRIGTSLARKFTRALVGSGEPLSSLTTGKADESEGRDSQDLDNVEIVVVGTPSEADANLHACTEGEALE